MSTKIPNKIILALFPKIQILGCYNSTPLKMNLVLEIHEDGDKRDVDFPPLDSSLLCLPVNLTPSNLPNCFRDSNKYSKPYSSYSNH